jgi:UDP-glucuronate decarboxylase
MLRHEQLLDEAVAHSALWSERLRGKSILVTGASGFLASSLLVFLSRMDLAYGLGLDLHATARRSPEEVDLFRFLNMKPPGNWSRASVEETRVPEIPGIIIVHTASFGSPADYQCEPIATFKANTNGLLRLYEQARAANASQVIYLSSAEIYGQPPDDQIPTCENYVGGLPTLSLRSIYGESKRMAEVLGACQAQLTGIPFTAIRPWNIYGPGQKLQDGRVPMEFMRQAATDGKISLMSNGSPRRSFCHAWTGVRQIAGLLGAPHLAGGWNVGFGLEETDMLETARSCARSYGLSKADVSYDSSAVAAGMQRSSPDTSKINRELGTIPPVLLSEGLLTLREWIDFLGSDDSKSFKKYKNRP